MTRGDAGAGTQREADVRSSMGVEDAERAREALKGIVGKRLTYIGLRYANVNGTYNGATSSSTMLMQRTKEDWPKSATSGGADTKY